VGRAFRSLATVVLLVAAAPTAAFSAETSVADTILEKAIASYRDGNLEPALGGINAALRGGLSSGLTARALYYRGLVYRKQGSPGHAISDLTRALDYDGLSEQERSDAMEARTAAYQEAGVADQEVVVISPTSGGGGKGPSQPPPQTTAAIVSPPATKPTTTNWGGATQVAANAPLPVPTAHQPEIAARSGTTQLAQPSKPTAKQAEKSAPAPAPAKPWVTEAKKPPIAAEKKPAPAARAVMPPKKPAVVLAKVEKASAPANPSAIEVTALAPLPASEMKVTKVAAAKAIEAPTPVDPFVTQVVAVMPPPPPAPVAVAALPAPVITPAPATPPEIRLLVGAAHSRSEAFALIVRLTSQRGAALGPRRPQIADATPPGSTPLYRLRLGPFADAGQAQSLCRSLNDSGYPCAVE
jgi:sporulation related protein